MERFFLAFSLVFLLSQNTLANSCCGQTPASFTVLSLEQSLSITSSYSYSTTQGRVYNSKEFYVWDDKKRNLESLQLSVASALSSRQQVFISSAFIQGRYADSFGTGKAQHLSDTQVGYSYEILPEYSFSYWRPVVFLTALANLPTGKSIYDQSLLTEGADVTGHNQWGIGLGLTLKKVYYPLTLTLQLKSLRLFPKSFANLKVSAFFENSVAFLVNYVTSYSSVSINTGITATQLTKRNISTTQVSSGVMQNTTVLIGLQKPLLSHWSLGLNYADQTLLGKARNTLLNKTYTLNLNYNYF